MKRSSQVALLLMGATGVGASAYAMTPQQNCPAPANPAAVSSPAVPGAPPATQGCQPRRSWGSGGSGSSWTRTNSSSHWSNPRFTRTTTSTPTPTRVSAAPTTTTTPTTSRPGGMSSTSRGGFGSTGGSHASSGG